MSRIPHRLLPLLAAGALLAPQAARAEGPTASAAKTQRCSVSPGGEGEVGIDRLRATRTTCRRARQVAAALRLAGRRGELERRPVAGGLRFRCTHRRRDSSQGEYFATRCTSGSRTVTMRFYGTGLVD